MSLAALRRRWWLVLLCTVAVAALAYGVGELRSRTATAEAVVMLNPGVIAPGPGAADQAARLAGDYARVIPQDDQLQRSLGATLGAPARGHVEVTADRRSALLDVAFRADGRAAAINGARAVARALTGPSPASANIVPGSLEVVRLPARARPQGAGHVAHAVLLTSSGGGPAGPGYGDQATKLAPSFAASIPDDAGVLRFVAGRLGVSTDDVEGNTSVKNDKDTTILRLQYRTRGRANAEEGARALADSVTGPRPASPTIMPNEFTLVRVDKATAPSSNPAVTLPIGAVLGLCLGIVLLLALERANPRVDDPDLLEEELRCPVYEVADVTPSLAGALLERWRALGGGDQPTVALVPSTVALEKATAGLANRLVAQANEEDAGFQPISGSLRVLIARAPADDPAGASVAAGSDVAVLVVLQGQELSKVRAARHALDNFEVPVQWALLLTRSARNRLARDATVVGERAREPAGASRV
jgi:hypothetical protein